MRQLFFVLILICLFSWIPGLQAQSGFTIGPSMSASWYNPAESGHGIMLDLIDEELAWLCWFAFDLDGNPAWICAIGNIVGDMIVFEQAFTVEGGNFPPLFDAEQIVQVPWGSITIIFTGCDDGSMEWSTNAEGFQSGSMPLTRLTPLWGNECQDSVAEEKITIPRSEVPVVVDGAIGAGEWDDAVGVQIVISEEWIVAVRLKNDGMNLFAVFSNVSGPNDENRVSNTRQTTTFPELFIDITPLETEQFDTSNHWFHMSFQDCYQAGSFRNTNNCNPLLAGWTANNWPLGSSGDHIEVSISYDRLQLSPEQGHSIRLFATMTSSLLGDIVYFNWPSTAIPHQPSSWSLADIQ